MKVDHFFTIGKKHEEYGTPCEDYVMSGELYTGNHKFAVISDGCSGAKSKTDIGSRLWCLAFERSLNNLDSHKLFMDFDFSDILIDEYQDKKVCTNINDEYASIVGLLGTEETAQIFIMGDGGYGIQYENGNYLLIEIQWENNKPFYPIYRTYDSYTYEILLSNFRSNSNRPVKIIEKEFITNTSSLTFSGFNISNFNLIREDISFHSLEEFENGYSKTFNIKEEKISDISIFSDGLWTIDNKNIATTLKEISIKSNSDKNFVKENMLKTINLWKKKNLMPIDDFSIANMSWKK